LGDLIPFLGQTNVSTGDCSRMPSNPIRSRYKPRRKQTASETDGESFFLLVRGGVSTGCGHQTEP